MSAFSNLTHILSPHLLLPSCSTHLFSAPLSVPFYFTPNCPLSGKSFVTEHQGLPILHPSCPLWADSFTATHVVSPHQTPSANFIDYFRCWDVCCSCWLGFLVNFEVTRCNCFCISPRPPAQDCTRCSYLESSAPRITIQIEPSAVSLSAPCSPLSLLHLRGSPLCCLSPPALLCVRTSVSFSFHLSRVCLFTLKSTFLFFLFALACYSQSLTGNYLG